MAIDTRVGFFIPTTEIIDVSSLAGKDLGSPEFKQFMIKLSQRFNDMAFALNAKDTGIYPLTEFLNSQTYFPDPTLSSTTAQAPSPRQVFRKVINFGALPNAGTKTVAHGITPTANYTFTRIYGTASDTTNFVYIPLPFVSVSGTVAAGNTELKVDATNVSVTTTGNGTNFNVCYIILEYLKN